MNWLKIRFCRALEEPLCTLTHPITLHRPWLWWFRNCPLSHAAFTLSERWDIADDAFTGVPEDDDDDEGP